MQNPSILNLQQVKQFQVRRPQITKGSPLLKTNQVQLAANIRNQSLLSDQPQHLKIKQQEEQDQQQNLTYHNRGMYNPFERRLQKQNQFDMKQDNIFQLKLSNEYQLNQINMQLIQKNKVLSNRLKQQAKLNEQFMEQIKKLQESNQAYEIQIHHLEEKIKKQKSKKKQLKEQIDQLQQELDEMQEKYQNNSNQDLNQEEDEQQQNHVPLTRQQLYQLMQYLYQGDHQQYENFHEYQDQEIDPDAMTYEQLLELEEQIGNVPKGLTKLQIKTLPKRVLDKDTMPEDKCSVCLFEFKEEEKVRELPCKHVYHSNCIKNWLQNNKQCPLCKTEVQVQPDPNQEEQQDGEDDQQQEDQQQDQQQDDYEIDQSEVE